MTTIVQKHQVGQRLDQVLANSFPIYSRSQIKYWILNKSVIINNTVSISPKKKMKEGELIEIKNINNFDIYQNNVFIPQNIPLNIVYEDDDILVINKPNNIAVHPGSGIYKNTILNALLYKYPYSCTFSNRAGIVHRLDKDTTGLMIIAKTCMAYKKLCQCFKKRCVIKKYEAIVFGRFSEITGIINKPICRHFSKRTRMIVHNSGKPAITYYSIIEEFDMHTWVRVCTKTGRTHQIRVHMEYINHPIVGDQKYNRFSSSLKKTVSNNKLIDYLSRFTRQALHACTLELLHPITKKEMQWNIPLPYDMLNLISVLRKN